MTGAMALQRLVGILLALLNIIAGEDVDVPCPKSGRTHLSGLRCYWLSEAAASWSDARDTCRQTQGGDLATAEGSDLQNFLHSSFQVKTTKWVWLKGLYGDDSHLGVDTARPARWEGDAESQAECPQMALGTLRRWRKTGCAGRYQFFCEKELTASLPTVDSYLVGLVLLTGIYTRTQIPPLLSIPDIGLLTVEMQLFPGLWFTHAGQLTSVELVVQPSPVSSLARVQILRPYCNPNHHLVPPGCSSLLNPFSCCSVVPLCNTTGGCSVGLYWCHLLEACLPTTSPCSPYVSAAVTRGFALPPRYPAIPPFYHLVADFPLSVNPMTELTTISVLLPGEAIMVYPDDIVAIQHTRSSGTLLHCINSEASLNAPWSQSYQSLRGPEWGGWLDGGLTSLPKESQWVDWVACDLRILYEDTLHGGTEHEDANGFTHTPATTPWDSAAAAAAPNPTPKFKLSIVHPPVDEKDQIHVQINVPSLIVVGALSGEKARCSWSAPALQTGLPFLPSCPELVVHSAPGCQRKPGDTWFSSTTFILDKVGVQTLNITVTDSVSAENLSVKVYGYEAVTGLGVEPHGHLRMLVGTPQLFTARIDSGSSVKFLWVIDNMEKFAYEGDSYSVVFKRPDEYKLKVTAANAVSSQSQQILLTADEMIPMSDPEFLFLKDVVTVAVTHVYTLRVKVDISSPLVFRWDFGDGSSDVVHTQSAPCQTMQGLVEGGEKQVYVQHSVNYTYSVSDDYILHVQVSNQYESIEKSTKICARLKLKRLHLSCSPPIPLVNQALLLEASTEPPADTIVYTWNFDDSETLRGTNRTVRHTFESAGVYNVTLCANNMVSEVTAWLTVEVMEKISGLHVSYDGPSELSSVTRFRATVASGTNLVWDFDYGDGSLLGNLTNGSVSHIYESPGNFSVRVTVSNSVSRAQNFIHAEVFRLSVGGILPTECVLSGRNTELTALVNGNISILTFLWLFGDASSLTEVRGKSMTNHTFASQGVFHLNLTVFSPVSSVSYNTSICVGTPITEMAVRSSQDVVAEGREVCFTVLLLPELTGCQFEWFSSSTSRAVVTEEPQKCFVFRDEGFEEVVVTASNTVSNKTVKASIAVQKPVGNFSALLDAESDGVTVNTSASFWVPQCTGSNVTVMWDFGDASPPQWNRNVSHIFTSTGQFTVTATAFNDISRLSVTLEVDVLHPVSDLSLHTSQPFVEVGQEALIMAVSSAGSSSNYYWTIDGVVPVHQGIYQFKFAFPRTGLYKVKAIAQNTVSKREAVILIEVLERIEGVHIDCQSLINTKYVPTEEELLFIGSVSKGSDVTYRWLSTHSEIPGDGEHFHLTLEIPGRVSVQLSASNKLGETTSTVSILAVQRVTGARMSTQSSIVVSGELVNISVSVVTGSDYLYLWYLGDGVSSLQTHVPFLLYNFTISGEYAVTISVQNAISQSNDTKLFLVQERVEGVNFRIFGTNHVFHVNTSDAVTFHGFVRRGTDLCWDWQIRYGDVNLLNSTRQTFTHTFLREGVYEVALNVSNGINWKVVSHNVTAQDEIEGLALHISRSVICTEEKVTFTPMISKGSNVSFVLTFEGKDGAFTRDVVEGMFTTSNLTVGTHLVKLKAWNQVSRAEASSHVVVIENIEVLRLVNNLPPALEAQKGILLKAEVQSESAVNYTWIFHLAGSEPEMLTGQEVVFTPRVNGSLSISVLATSRACSKMLNGTAKVEWPAKKVKLFCHSAKIFIGYAVKFYAKDNGGSNLRYQWDFGDTTETMLTDLHEVTHTYYTPGKYNVTVNVLNDVSHVSTQLLIFVEELECSGPQASLIQRESIILRSAPSFFEANVDMNCSAYKTAYLWEIFRVSDFTKDGVDYAGDRVLLDNATSTFLIVPKHFLSVGQYYLVFTVSLRGTPLFIQRRGKATVIHSSLVAVIRGGSQRLWPSSSDLLLDGSDSYDPDVESRAEDELQYHWTCMAVKPKKPCSGEQLGENNNGVLIVLSEQLLPGTVYIFTLTVRKMGRSPALSTQEVTVSKAPVLPVSVECVSCSLASKHRISYHNPLILSGKCGECDDRTQYKWIAEDQTGVTLDLAEVSTSTGGLVLASDALQPGQTYTFTLNVMQPRSGRWGRSSFTIIPNNPPHGGQCELSPEADIHLLETVVSFTCSGWRGGESEASQLIYTFQVFPCQPNFTTCQMLTLYRGTRSTFGSLVPVGSRGQEKNTSVITVILLVEDSLGAKVVALNRTLTVLSDMRENIACQWLGNKSRTELWALTQRGNPQEIIPYSIALISQLNRVEFGQSITKIAVRREIRQNVTRALASLSVTSLHDVDQISSALAQSTAIPDELICQGCQRKLLEAVGRMIRVIEEEMSSGVPSAVDTGRNILNVIGSSLAATADTADVSGSHLINSSHLQSESAIALSALCHAGTLMRSLMHSHVLGEKPLLLSTPYISTVGFHGNSSDLLCARQSNQSNAHRVIPARSPFTGGSESCPFQIPTALAAHLENQTSQLVQVLLSVDGALEAHPLLTAANPPISTILVAMELSTSEGNPMSIQDLDPEQAITVTLLNNRKGAGDERANGSCLTERLLPGGQLNFGVKAIDGLDENTGLFLSFNFSLLPGGYPSRTGRIKMDMGSTEPGSDKSQDSFSKEWVLNLTSLRSYTEETIFLSPHLNRTAQRLTVNLTSSLTDGGPVLVSACVFSSLCQFYSLEERRWRSEGLQPLEGSTLHAAHCLTQHLTMFGASLFVHPEALVLLPPSGGPVRNTVVGIVCAVLVLIHLLVGLIAHKLDHLDSLRLSQVPLCGRPGLFQYRVLVKTGRRHGAGTTAHVGISLYGVNKSGSHHLQREGAFQRGRLDQFQIETDDNLGEIWKIRIWHDNTGLDPSWYVQHVVVWNPITDHMFFFLVEDWLSVENQKNGAVDKDVLASCPEELSHFGRVLASQLTFGMAEHHLWLSLWERPAHSLFTRGQRVTCSALMLHLYMALGALWYGAVGSEGHSGPVSEQMPVSMETIAAGMTIAALVFPLQCFLCFLFRKAHSQVMVDMSDPPSPACHSVEMDIHLEQSGFSGPSFLFQPDSSRPDSPSSFLESKAFDSSILDFWATSGLMPQRVGSCQEEGVATWASYDSLLHQSACLSDKTTESPDRNGTSLALCSARRLKRKKALLQLHLSSNSSSNLPKAFLPTLYVHPLTQGVLDTDPSLPVMCRDIFTGNADPPQIQSCNLPTFLSLSEEDLLKSIAAAADDTVKTNKSNSDSGRYSPRTTSSFSNTQSTSCSSWSDQSEEKSLYEAEIHMFDIQSSPSLDESKLYKRPSTLSVNSVASTFLPSASPDSTRSSSTTRIGVARGQPSWVLPPWTLCVIYLLVATLLATCLAIVGLYGSFFSSAVVLMWLTSAVSAFFASALLLEPLKVCVQALICTALWRPVDPEVEDLLAQQTTVVTVFDRNGGKVRPPCGYGLLQAKEEARKVRTLRSLMRQSVWQLLFLLLVLMINYQDSMEQRQGRLLLSTVRRRLSTAPSGAPYLTSVRDWPDAGIWMRKTLLTHLHQNPVLHLVGLPRLRVAQIPGPVAYILLGNSSGGTRQLLVDLHMEDWSAKQFNTLSVDFTHHHRESGLFLCVSIQLDWPQTHRVTHSLSMYPLHIPSSLTSLDLNVVLTVLLLMSALSILSGELWSVASERTLHLRQGKHWLQLLLALLSLATSILQLCSLSQATSCVSKLQGQSNIYVDFHGPALLAQRSSQCAAVLLTLLVLKLLGTLRFVRRWVVISRVLQRAWRELRALSVLLLLLLLFCAHLGNILFSSSAEGFLSMHRAGVSVLSLLSGRIDFQRICRARPILGPLFGLLLMGGGVWLLARLCGAILIHSYRAEQADIYRPAVEPQDYEMVDFFIKRLKLWTGLTKAKEFRHRVKFEDMDVPPSRLSQASHLSTLSSSLSPSHSPSLSSSFSSPRPLSSSLSVQSEESSVSEHGFVVQPYLENLLPCVSALLSRFDSVNRIIEDVHNLEIELEQALETRRRRRISNKEQNAKRHPDSQEPKEHEGEGGVTEVRHRRKGLLYPKPHISLPTSFSFAPSIIQSSGCVFPRLRSSYSESHSVQLQYHPSSDTRPREADKPASPEFSRLPRRRAWHSGSSHSADAAQRMLRKQGAHGRESFASCDARPGSAGGLRRRISDGIPQKRKAWISEGPEAELI